MSLRRERALAKLRKLRDELQRRGLPARMDVHHVGALAHALIERLGEREDAARASAAAEYLYRIATPSFAATGIETQLACRRGCDYCCHGYVSATAPQIFAAARAIRARALDFETARARVAAAATTVRGLDWVTRCRMHEPCPLLLDGACSIYAARPLACRGFASFSADACKSAFEQHGADVPVPQAYGGVRSALESALRAALKHHGLPYASYEFDTALERVLDAAGAEAAWLAGDDVFAGVDIDRSAHPGEALQREIVLDTLIAIARGETPANLTAARPA